MGIEYVTMYAFSTENWSRPREEVDGLMLLMGEFIEREGRALHEEGVQVRHLGSTEGIPLRLQRRIEWLLNLTRDNTRITAAVAMNYGGRRDVVGAVRSMVVDGLRIEEINEGALAQRLSTNGMPDPDPYRSHGWGMAALQLPGLAGRLQRVLEHPGALAGLQRRLSARRAGRLRPARAGASAGSPPRSQRRRGVRATSCRCSRSPRLLTAPPRSRPSPTQHPCRCRSPRQRPSHHPIPRPLMPPS